MLKTTPSFPQEMKANRHLKVAVWKKVNTKKKALISLGVPKREAWMLANSRKAYARCASSFLNNVLTNKRLKERGLVFLLDQYDLKHC